jgi:hypothetical protein
MNSTVINSQNEQGARSITSELIAALELAVEHWDDLNPTQRENAFRIACEHVPEDRRPEAIERLWAIFFEAVGTATAH